MTDDAMVRGQPVGPPSAEDALARLIEAWEPSTTPACHSCSGARVCRADDGTITARCNHAGADMPLARLLRGRYGRGFRPAKGCDAWDPS